MISMIELTTSKKLLSDFEAESGLRFEYLWEPDDRLLTSDFYPGYDQSFVIDSEKEELKGFTDCLALNMGDTYRQLSTQNGPYREYVLVAYNKTGTVVGGANFLCLLLQDVPVNGKAAITINLNYLFVLPAQRGKGYLRPILKACSHLSLETLRHTKSDLETISEPIVFFEQNDPVRMSLKDYEDDSRQSGLDQIQRIAIWAKIGARIIDIPYVQPALSENQEDDHNLLYCVICGDAATSLDPCLLKAHLERFFHISVFKNATENAANTAANNQLSMLAKRCQQGMAIRLANGGIWASRSLHLGSKVVGIADSLRDLIFTC